jgi:hypothetical protein
MYNPLQFFSPLNARFDQAGQIAGQIAETDRLRAGRQKQEQGAQRFLGLQQLGQYQPEELQDPQVQAQMQQAQMDMLGSPEKYMNYQMRQQELDARRRKEEALADPRVQELMLIQKDSDLKAKGLVSKYLNTDTIEEKQAIEAEYINLSKISNEAGAELGSNPSISGWQYTPMPNFYRMVESAVKGRGAQGLQEIEKETKEYTRDKVKVESEAIEERTRLSRQKQQADLVKMEEDRGRTKHNQITKVLKDSGLSEPFVYDSIIEDAQFAVDKKNIFTAVKLLSNVIEPGLSVTEGEVEGYTVGGTSRFNKFLQKLGGAGETDMNRILELLKGIANNRKGQAQKIIDRGGQRSEPTPNVTDADPLGLF